MTSSLPSNVSYYIYKAGNSTGSLVARLVQVRDQNISTDDEPANDGTGQRPGFFQRNKTLTGVAIGTAVGAGVAVVAAPLAIAAVGFGTAGVVPGSAAAAWQSSIGAVAAGSFFASLQSAGAVGLTAGATVGIGAAGAGAGATTAGAGVGIFKLISKLKGTQASDVE